MSESEWDWEVIPKPLPSSRAQTDLRPHLSERQRGGRTRTAYTLWAELAAAEACKAMTSTREACAMAIRKRRGGCARATIVAKRELSGLTLAERLASR